MSKDFDTIMPPEVLASQIAPESDHPLPLIVDCRFNLMQPEQGPKEYVAGHIPGAYYAHLDDDLSSPATEDSGRHPLPDRERFARLAGSWGVTPDTQVVVYDHGTGAVAARLWWLMRWIGHNGVAVLDGGFKAWNAIGGAIDSVIPSPRTGALAAGVAGEHAPQIRVQELMKNLGRVPLLDARDAVRFRGEKESLDSVAGHVPGASNRPFTENLDSSGRFLPPEVLRQQFRSLIGEDRDDGTGVVHMCGSGITACHNILAMERAKLPGATLYVGSWSEWIRDDTRPVATGE